MPKIAASSLPVRGAWIEMYYKGNGGGNQWSLPVRGAWIEIPVKSWTCAGYLVAPRAGSVD